VTVIAAGFDEPAVGRARPRTASYGTALPSAELAAANAQASAGAEPASSQWRPFQIEPKTAAAVPESPAPAAAAAPPVTAAADAGPGGQGGDGAAAAAVGENAAGRDGAGRDGAKIDGIPPQRTAGTEAGSALAGKDSQGGKTGNGRPADPPGTRRKSVVFEEDDELDVPDFLK
jgi:cell division protein FtsZ